MRHWISLRKHLPAFHYLSSFLSEGASFASHLSPGFSSEPLWFCFFVSSLLPSVAQRWIAFEWRPWPCVLLTISEPCNYVILCPGFAPSQRPQSALVQSHVRKGWLDVSVSFFEQPLCTIIWSVWCATWPVPAMKVPYKGNSLHSNNVILLLFWKKEKCLLCFFGLHNFWKSERQAEQLFCDVTVLTLVV